MTNEEIAHVNIRAFPSDSNFNKGITLLDYFAAKVLQTYQSAGEHGDDTLKKRTRDCYRMAVAMLEARREFIK